MHVFTDLTDFAEIGTIINRIDNFRYVIFTDRNYFEKRTSVEVYDIL